MRHRHFKTSNTFPNYASHNYKSARSVYARVNVITDVYTYVSTRCISCISATAAEMATATADDVYVHWIQCCIRGYTMYTSGSGTHHWRNPGICSRAGQHARSLRCGGVPSNVLARVHPWVSFEKSWLSFCLSGAHAMATIDCGFCDTS